MQQSRAVQSAWHRALGEEEYDREGGWAGGLHPNHGILTLGPDINEDLTPVSGLRTVDTGLSHCCSQR